MSTVITAIYEKGLLRPLSPLSLREHQTVRIQLLSEKPLPADGAGEIIQLMVAAGLMRPPLPRETPPDPVSEQERRELADILGRAPGTPLSELVIEERGAW